MESISLLLADNLECVCLVTQLCLNLCDPMDCTLPGSSVHETRQPRILKWVAVSFSRESSWLRDRTWTSCTAGRRLTIWSVTGHQRHWISWPRSSCALWLWEFGFWRQAAWVKNFGCVSSWSHDLEQVIHSKHSNNHSSYLLLLWRFEWDSISFLTHGNSDLSLPVINFSKSLSCRNKWET